MKPALVVLTALLLADGKILAAAPAPSTAPSRKIVDGLQILPAELACEERAAKRPSGYANIGSGIR